MSGVTVDTSRFDSALKRYLSSTSKTLPVALNGKSKDLAFRAAQATPKSTMTAAQFKTQQTDPEIVGSVAKRIYNRRGGGRSYQEIYERTEGTMALKKFGKGYMKSGYAKAGHAFKNVGDASRIKAEARADPSQPSKAHVMQATPNFLSAVSEVIWKAFGKRDANEKQGIVSPALAKAAAHVVADIEGYLSKKMGAEAKKVSA